MLIILELCLEICSSFIHRIHVREVLSKVRKGYIKFYGLYHGVMSAGVVRVSLISVDVAGVCWDV